MSANLAQTPLHAWHVAHGARMVDFAGWSMPVQYTSIVEEHRATRTAAGLFDISHMGRLRFEGPHAGDYLDSLVTRRVAHLPPGQIAYALVCNDQGGVLDDVLVYHLHSLAGQPYWLMVCNASNRAKIVDWLQQHPPQWDDVLWMDATLDWAMMAVQGPQAVGLVEPLLAEGVAPRRSYTGHETRIAGHGGIVSRTGYTGEDGVELIVGHRVAEEIWNTLYQRGQSLGLRPCGLGARDTLRLEAAMPLYGHELDEHTDPLQAGLRFAVDLDKRPYPGRDALRRIHEAGLSRRRVGLAIDGRRVPREGYPVLAGQEVVGRITSGTFSPTLEMPVAMAYVDSGHAALGTNLEVDIRGNRAAAKVVKLPFYRRQQKDTQP